MRILIVEDEPLIALSLVAELEDAGHQVLGVTDNFEDARTLAEQKHPGLALVDIDLKEKRDGIRVARALTTECAVPVLFVTGQVDLARKNSDSGLGVIGKPFNPADVARGVDAISCIINGGSPPPPPIPGALELFRH